MMGQFILFLLGGLNELVVEVMLTAKEDKDLYAVKVKMIPLPVKYQDDSQGSWKS